MNSWSCMAWYGRIVKGVCLAALGGFMLQGCSDDVKGAFAALGLQKPAKCTWGDATYLANMYYSDFAQLLKSETDAVRMAHAAINDVDGYEGMAFNRYTADIMEKGVCVPWNEVI